jgi:GNAT superfamily N-acetyltransferase
MRVPKPKKTPQLEIHPVTPERLPDLEKLFGPRGACQDCWCLFWRVRHSEFNKMRPDERRLGLKALADSGDAPGLLAYQEGEPVGWCAVAPREAYEAIEHSRNLKRVDEQACWAVPCFFVARSARRSGVTQALLRGALDFALQRGARIVEGYPIDTHGQRRPSDGLFTGVAATFRRAGFKVARREPRLIMRYRVPDHR